jgi:hypothetical protein
MLSIGRANKHIVKSAAGIRRVYSLDDESQPEHEANIS